MDDELQNLFSGHPKSFYEYLQHTVKGLMPDYPYSLNHAYEYLWALSEGYKGVSAACDDWHKLYNDQKAELERLKVENAELRSRIENCQEIAMERGEYDE